MSSSILDEFKALIPPSRRTSSKGWFNFCCPSCGDKRYRGGFNYTPTGGFRYYCFNGGCEFNINPTGWEPGNGFGGRPRKLFEAMGGTISSIPLDEVMKWNKTRYNAAGEVIGEVEELEVVNKFETINLPQGSDLIVDVANHNKQAMKVFDYLLTRDNTHLRTFPYMWSPKHPNHLIVPFMHFNNQIVGWLGRHIYKQYGADRFIGYAPKDYMFNQHLLSLRSSKYAFVLESPMDAITLECIATRGDRLSQKQINLLKMSGQEPVLIPDLIKGEGNEFINIAEKNEWNISVPDFLDKKIKDVGGSVMTNGRLFTLEAITNAITNDNFDTIRNLHFNRRANK